MNQKKYLISRISIYPIILFCIFLSSIDALSSRLIGFFLVLIYLTDIFRLIKSSSLFSPFLFSNMFMASYGLYEMGLSLQISELKVEAKILVVLCMYIWDIISVFNKYNFKIQEKKVFDYDLNLEKFKKIIYILFFTASVCMFYEWYKFGGIPVMSENLELERFNISINPLVHILAVMHRIIIVLACAVVIKQKKNFLLKIIIIISFLFLLGLGARAEILYPVLIVTIMFYFSSHIKIKTMIKTGIIAIIVIGVYPLVRKYLLFGESYITDLISISRYKSIFFLTPLYESFAYNFEVFGLDFNSFPEVVPHGYGSYTILNNIPFVDAGRSITEVQNYLLGNNFYAGLASTYLGSVYADYGFLGSIIYTGLISLMINKVFSMYIKYRKMSILILYSYLFYGVLMGFYHYVFDVVFIFYLLLILIVLFVSKKRGFN